MTAPRETTRNAAISRDDLSKCASGRVGEVAACANDSIQQSGEPTDRRGWPHAAALTKEAHMTFKELLAKTEPISETLATLANEAEEDEFAPWVVEALKQAAYYAGLSNDALSEFVPA